VVGKEDQFPLLYCVLNHHSAKEIRAVFPGVESGKANKLIGYDVSAFGNSPLIDNHIVGVLLQSGHKEYCLRAPVRKKPVKSLYPQSMATRKPGETGTFRAMVTSCRFPFDIET